MIPLDSIQIISLPHRRDRRDILIPTIKKAIDLGVFPDLEIEIVNRFPVETSLVPSWWEFSESYYRCTREHTEILQNLYQRRSKLALILEDDAIIKNNLYTDLEPFYNEVNRIRPEWASLFIGGRDTKNKGRERINDLVSLNRGCLGSHAYIVNPIGMKLLHDHISKGEDIVDWGYLKLMGKHSVFYSPPDYMVDTQPGWSDNLNKFSSF